MRDYYDETLLYCLDDGSALLDGPALASNTPTAIFGSGFTSSEDRQTAVLASGAATAVENSIAVLPFANMSADPENEFFCDGLAEELLNALTKIESMKVAARTSAFSFKGSNTKVSEIGNVLGVRHVLEGSVRKAGDRVRITVQLANAADGYHIWSERYDREMKDIFAVQDEITLAIVDALKVKLLGDERSAILKKATDNPEAYELYLRGRAFWNRRTPPDFEKAIEYFQRAISIDPNYALAYSGIADSYSLLAYFEAFAPDEMRKKARDAARTAVELDPNSAESHTSIAMYELLFEFNWDACEEHFKRALEINPRFVIALYLYGTHLASQKRFEESYKKGNAALELDPLSQPLNGNVARAFYIGRRYDDAIDLALKNLEISPDFFFTHWVLGVSYRQLGQLDDAIHHLRQAVAGSGIYALKGDLGVALALAGRTDEARELLMELESESSVRYVSPQWSSVIYAALGEKEKAIAFLKKAYDIRAIQLVWLAVDPNFDPLRDEPEFKEIFAKMAMPVDGGGVVRN
jgi:TolB-like protein/Tfp pilus assembly protein PilF